MDFSPIINQSLLGIGSVVFAELVRDTYHLAGHYVPLLQRYHTLHHKVYRRDLTIASLEAYRTAQLLNDTPEAIVMVMVTVLLAWALHSSGFLLGGLYSLGFLMTALARSQGLLMATDLTHKPGDLTTIPSQWTVNRTYHWRHHFDQGNAYFCGYFTVVDKLLGTALSLKGKVVAVTGASGTMGRALIHQLAQQGARVVALSSSSQAVFPPGVEVISWSLGEEEALRSRLQSVDILIINHGINVHGDRTAEAIQTSFQVNTWSAWTLAELFLSTVNKSEHRALKELWINTSEAEVSPAFSPLYELSKRTLGNLITLRRLDAPCVIRKLILGPFKSNLNPVGVMSADWVAGAIVALAKRDFRDIIVTINPITYIAFPMKEFFQSLYFRCFTRGRR